jgi:Bacteriophage related domain of unknown function
MSGWAEERRVLQSWFADQWAHLAGPINAVSVPVEFEGQVFDTPPDGRAYISMYLIGASSGTQVSLGSDPLSRYVGMVQFTISCPIGGSGAANDTARQIADALHGLWKGRRFRTSGGRIRCRVPGLHTVGNSGNRFVAVLTVPYLRDEIEPTPDPVGLA